MNSRKNALLAVALAAAFSFVAPAFAHRPPHTKPRMEVVFVLDTTGSMSGMISGAKQKIWAIANRLKSAQPTPDISFGLVGYRDRGDAYVTKEFGLTTNLDEVYSNLHAFEAQGGGDEPESVNEALNAAVRDMQWSTGKDVLRVIFLVGDARPHMDYQDDVKYATSCRLANTKGILINTLQCGSLSGTEDAWRDIAAKTNGSYAAILQNGGSIRIDTPYDERIRELNIELNATIILYGSHAEQASAARNADSLKMLSREAMAERSSFMAKDEAGKAVTGGGDLVVEVMNGRQDLDKIEKDKLDPKLQSMPETERNKLIAQKVGERRRIQAELNELIARRDALVAEKTKKLETEGGEASLELNAFKVLAEQASAKGFEFETKD